MTRPEQQSGGQVDVLAAAPALHQAAEAMAAWFWAENSHGEISWQARMELCNYAEYLNNKALAIADGRDLPESYEGVPRIVVQFPHAGIERHEAAEVQAVVDAVLVKYRAAIARAVSP